MGGFFFGIHKKLTHTTLGEINVKFDLKIQPAQRYTVGLQGIIMMFTLAFCIYQALPGSWIPSRNDTLIFGEIGPWFIANQLFAGIWVIIFVQDTKAMYFLAELLNIGLLYATGWMTMASCRAKLNFFEILVIRGGFSLSAGWAFTANIIGVFMFWKACKSPTVDDDGFKAIKEESDKKERSLVNMSLYFMFLVYAGLSLEELNPAYGFVFLVVLQAIVAEASVTTLKISATESVPVTGKDQNGAVTDTCSLLLKIHGVVMVAITGYSIYERTQGAKRGLFY